MKVTIISCASCLTKQEKWFTYCSPKFKHTPVLHSPDWPFVTLGRSNVWKDRVVSSVPSKVRNPTITSGMPSRKDCAQNLSSLERNRSWSFAVRIAIEVFSSMHLLGCPVKCSVHATLIESLHEKRQRTHPVNERTSDAVHFGSQNNSHVGYLGLDDGAPLNVGVHGSAPVFRANGRIWWRGRRAIGLKGVPVIREESMLWLHIFSGRRAPVSFMS